VLLQQQPLVLGRRQQLGTGLVFFFASGFSCAASRQAVNFLLCGSWGQQQASAVRGHHQQQQ
jgi:hypothetical protein